MTHNIPIAAILLAIGFLAACNTEPAPELLQEGTWTGGLTPMNHPDITNPVTYHVQNQGQVQSIDIVGPGGKAIPVRGIRLTPDTLFFSFEEPEEGVTLSCALARQEIGYAGRCTDVSGKWARFYMFPPEE